MELAPLAETLSYDNGPAEICWAESDQRWRVATPGFRPPHLFQGRSCFTFQRALHNEYTHICLHLILSSVAYIIPLQADNFFLNNFPSPFPTPPQKSVTSFNDIISEP